jgi:adiponectin receptor
MEETKLLKNAEAATLERQITSALVAVLASKSRLITISELPIPWRYNHYIFTGYRFTETYHQCIRSIFSTHNETFNIWSHILACVGLSATLLFGSAPLTTGDDDRLLMSTYYFFLVASIACTACSVCWHTMRCISAHSTMSCFSSIDCMGVTLLILASVLVTQFVAFSHSPFWQYIYMGGSLTLGVLGLLVSWLPIMRRPENNWTRVLVWACLIVQGVVVPVTHVLSSQGLGRMNDIYGPILPAYGPIVVGAVIYATQFPECCWPGCFDYLGASHNLWHILSVWGIWLGVDALRNLPRTVGRAM